MSDHPNALPSGFHIQEYELVRTLGSGGFAITYLAFDNNMDRGSAIKEYLPRNLSKRELDNTVVANSIEAQEEFDWGLERFLEEARTLAKFDHPNIVKVYRSFSAHGTGYIVMEYAEGDTFSEYLERKGTLSEAELKKIVLPILQGLEKVHAADFLHRDIKPLNIIIRDTDDSAVLIDFGSARQAIGEKDKHLTALVSGGYAPIEQYSSRGNQGPWTDIYALGALCYRALSGEDPYAATDRIKNDPLVPISTRCKGKVSTEFLKAIDWALTVDEQERPQNVNEWIRAINGEELTTVISKSTTDSSNKLKKTIVAAVVLVAVIGIGAMVMRTGSPADDQSDLPDNPAATLEPAASTEEQTELADATSAIDTDTLSDDDLINEAIAEFAAYQIQRAAGDATSLQLEPEMILISQGGFEMGDTLGDGDSDEGPVRSVNFEQNFYLSKYEVTYLDYARFADDTQRDLPQTSNFGVENKPAINVSWNDAVAYAQWLGTQTNQSYRLPTEAEWEYAAKSGSNTNYPWGNDIQTDRANCDTCKVDNSEDGTVKIGSYAANLGGLYDMHGNVWEWVQDCAHDGYVGAPENGAAWQTDPDCSRVLRGGAWNSTPYQLRSSYRNWRPASESANTIGFRLVREN
ncbi:MAG: hypothetical protein COA96_04510 [SAR86 cluster bacterium]|uniref:Protein kinase domain-containing protein n=1 Tax=SAR86 cluster bacterium TaxID=2030880 RepID=A0A2A5B7A8_9GAMM|nr:MAG: hypothetical protein COA96_04510 [SAR86 cluster bacterium]